MRGTTYRILAGLGLLVLLATASCTSNELDDSGSADVIMLISQMDTPTVTAQIKTATSGTCSGTGTLCQSNQDCGLNDVCIRVDTCILEVTEWTANISAEPKNPLALPPFNNIVMVDVTISYNWLNPAIVTPNYVAGLRNVTIPAQGSGQVTFFPIPSDIVNSNPAIEGATANLTMTFRGVTVEGSTVLQVAQAQLVVEICT